MSGELWTEYPSAEGPRPVLSDKLHNELVLHLQGQHMDADPERDDIVEVADLLYLIDRLREDASLLTIKKRLDVADYMQLVLENLRYMTDEEAAEMNAKCNPAQEETKGE